MLFFSAKDYGNEKIFVSLYKNKPNLKIKL